MQIPGLNQLSPAHGAVRLARAAGVTLIELLVAVAMTVLLLGVALGICAAAFNALTAQAVRAEILDPAVLVLNRMQRDLFCALAPQNLDGVSFQLSAADESDRQFNLHFYTAQPVDGAGSHIYGIDEVIYSLGQDENLNKVLIRRHRPLRIAPRFNPRQSPESLNARTGEQWMSPVGVQSQAGASNMPPAFEVEKLACVPTSLAVWVYDGKQWTNQWSGTDQALPQAARIKLRVTLPSGIRSLVAETLIPTGRTINPDSKSPKPGLFR